MAHHFETNGAPGLERGPGTKVVSINRFLLVRVVHVPEDALQSLPQRLNPLCPRYPGCVLMQLVRCGSVKGHDSMQK